MNSLSHLVEKYSVPTKDQDSTALKIMHEAVVVPKKIELKLQKPSIKLLPEANDSSSQQRQKVIFERKAKEQQLLSASVNSNELSQSNFDGPDTLDIVLINNWISSGFKHTLWSSASNDSVCIIPYNYFSRTLTTNSLKDRVKHSNKPDNQLNSTDSTSILQRAEQTPINSFSRQEESFSQPKHYNLLTEPWFITVLLLFVAITGIIRLKWQSYLNKIFQAITFSAIATKLQASSGSKEKIASFFLNILFYGNFSLFLYEYMVFKDHSYFHWTGWSLWLLIAAFLIAISFLKTIVYKFIGWVFRIQQQTTNYLFQSTVMNKAYGVILMPLVVIFPFLNPEACQIVFKIGLAAFILLYLIQIVRGIRANLKDALSVYYIILYLCALEILPLSILYKVLFH